MSEEIILAEFLELIETSSLLSLTTSNATIEDLLYQTVKAKCSDPGDGVFSMLGMAREDIGIEPDYEKTVEKVYQDFALRYIEYYDFQC